MKRRIRGEGLLREKRGRREKKNRGQEDVTRQEKN